MIMAPARAQFDASGWSDAWRPRAAGVGGAGGSAGGGGGGEGAADRRTAQGAGRQRGHGCAAKGAPRTIAAKTKKSDPSGRDGQRVCVPPLLPHGCYDANLIVTKTDHRNCFRVSIVLTTHDACLLGWLRVQPTRLSVRVEMQAAAAEAAEAARRAEEAEAAAAAAAAALSGEGAAASAAKAEADRLQSTIAELTLKFDESERSRDALAAELEEMRSSMSAAATAREAELASVRAELAATAEAAAAAKGGKDETEAAVLAARRKLASLESQLEQAKSRAAGIIASHGLERKRRRGEA
eukprot:6177167-Pleurochrysis_carterae.AAC.2